MGISLTAQRNSPFAFASGNLCYQIEHHLFPDLPSNRYAQIAVRVRALCDKYDLPYTSGSLVHQYLLTLRTIHKLALPEVSSLRRPTMRQRLLRNESSVPTRCQPPDWLAR